MGIVILHFKNALNSYDNTPFAAYTLSTMNNDKPAMSRKQRIQNALSLEIKPETLIIEDESHRHQVPAGAETHFKVVAVSTCFEHLNRVARHRLINRCLATEFTTGLHALSLHLYTPDEWSRKTKNIPASPPCQHDS